MTAHKCLACGESNTSGEESCRHCSSSLNLKLCGACEAINAGTAARCHGCGFAFDALDTFQARVEAFGAAIRAPESAIAVAGSAVQLPAMRATRLYAEAPAPRPRSMGWRALLLAAPLAAVGAVAFLFYPGYPSASSASARGTLVPAVAPLAPLAPSTAVEPASEPAPIETAPPPEPVRAPQVGPARVTHTKPAPLAAPAVPKAEPPVAAHAARPADCHEGIAALGLCGTQKGKGN